MAVTHTNTCVVSKDICNILLFQQQSPETRMFRSLCTFDILPAFCFLVVHSNCLVFILSSNKVPCTTQLVVFRKAILYGFREMQLFREAPLNISRVFIHRHSFIIYQFTDQIVTISSINCNKSYRNHENFVHH